MNLLSHISLLSIPVLQPPIAFSGGDCSQQSPQAIPVVQIKLPVTLPDEEATEYGLKYVIRLFFPLQPFVKPSACQTDNPPRVPLEHFGGCSLATFCKPRIDISKCFCRHDLLQIELQANSNLVIL